MIQLPLLNLQLFWLPISTQHINTPISTQHINKPISTQHINTPISTQHINTPISPKQYYTKCRHAYSIVAITGAYHGHFIEVQQLKVVISLHRNFYIDSQTIYFSERSIQAHCIL